MSQVYTAGTKFKFIDFNGVSGVKFFETSHPGINRLVSMGEDFAYHMRQGELHFLLPLTPGYRGKHYVLVTDDDFEKDFVQMKNEKAVHTIATLNIGDVIKNTESLYLDSSCGTARCFLVGGHEFEVKGFLHDGTRNKMIVQDKTGKFFVHESDLSKFERAEMFEYKPWAIPLHARPFGVKPEYVTSVDELRKPYSTYRRHPLVKQSYARAEADRFIALNQELFIAHWIKHNPDENFDDYILVHQARDDGSVAFSMERKVPKANLAKQGAEEFKANLKRWTEQVNNGWISSSDFQRHICNYKFPGVDDV